LINQLHDAMKTGKGSSEAGAILKGLTDYTHYHFVAEENLLEKNSYPGLLSQQSKHKAFVAKLQEFELNMKSKDLGIGMKISQFLKDWLVEHISGEDKKYGNYLNNKGIH
ncbi:MAG TPA: bacteriohemerythrin, partial [Leptolinea sp.]